MGNKPKHSPLGASSMYRWRACPGSVKLCQGIKSKPSSYAEEGTKAHEVAAKYLETGHWPEEAVDGDILDAVDVYVREVGKASVQKETELFVEKKFDLSSVHPLLYGTADAVVWDPRVKIMRVFDYKHGAGIPVEVEDNPQLLYYALGALLNLKVPAKHAKYVEVVIVQPRCPHPDGPVRKKIYSVMEVLIDFKDELFEAAKRTEAENAPLNSGDHCRFCPGAAICPLLNQNAVEVAKEIFSEVTSYDPEKLAKALHWLPTLEAWIKQVRAFAYEEATQGRTPPGFKLVNKRATRRWNNEVDAADTMQARLLVQNEDVDWLFNKKLKSPTQIEAFLKQSNVSLKFADLVNKMSTGYTLVPVSDKREAVSFDPAAVFDAVDEDQENVVET